MKKATSIRLEEQQIRQLKVLVQYYKEASKDFTGFNVKVNQTTVVEMLIKNEYNRLLENGKLNKILK